MRKRLIITEGVVIFVSLILMLVFLGFFVSRESNINNEKNLNNYVSIASNIFDGSNFEETKNAFSLEDNIRITIIDNNGNVVEDNFSSENDNHLSRPEIQDLGTVYYRYSDSLKMDMAYLATIDNDYYIRIAIPRYDLDNLINTLLIYGSIGLVIITIIDIFCAYFLTKNLYKPIVSELNKTSLLIGDNKELKGDDIELIHDEIVSLNSSLREKIALLKLEKDKIDFILNHINQGLIIVDENGKIIMFNNVAGKILNIDQDHALNQSYLYLTRDESFINNLEICLKEGIQQSFDYASEGKTYLIDIERISSKYSFASSANLISVMLIDITSKKEIDTIKGEFFQNASHELKTPLTSIIGSLQLIKHNIVTKKKEVIELITSSLEEANKMNQLIVEMLDLSRIELKEEKKIEHLNVKDFVNDVITSLALDINEKHLKVNLTLDDCFININRGDLDKLISNLITNAVKYNVKNGTLSLTLNQTFFKVEDSGIGIEEKELNNIFKRFYRVEGNNIQGSGLGLSIVKHIVQNYNFKIEVESTLGAGSTFTVFFKD